MDPSEFLNDTTTKKSATKSLLEYSEDYGQGEWLMGREVLKFFCKKYYKEINPLYRQ
jgi:hypothetical protein